MSADHLVFTREVNGAVQICAFVDHQQSEHKDKVHLSSITVPYGESENGLPEGGDFKKISKIEDRLIAEFERLDGIHIGHIISAGAMRTWFRSRQKPPTEMDVKTGLFKKEKFQLTNYDDPNWSIGDTEVKPQPIEFEKAHNTTLHMTLNEHGDIAESIRKVDFFAYFISREVADGFAAEISAHGFSIGEITEHDQKHELRFGLEFSKEMNVVPNDIAHVCHEVRGIVGKHGGDFDGWACPVVTE